MIKGYKDLKVNFRHLVSISSQVIIVPHIHPDLDAIASSYGVSKLVKHMNKPSFILLDGCLDKYDDSTKKMLRENKEKYSFLTFPEYTLKRKSKDLMITVDVNKKNRIPCNDLSLFENILIIDHHFRDDNTIKTPYQMIDPFVSSASEIISELLNRFHVTPSKKLAECLLAGIYLDTEHLSRNTTPKTLEVCSNLLKRGVSLDKISDYFLENFESDRRMHKLIAQTEFIDSSLAITIDESEQIYTKEEIAKAANYLLKFPVEGSLVAAKIEEDCISLSARSKGNINISSLVSGLSENSGGNECLAAALFSKMEAKDVKNKVYEKVLLVQNKKNTCQTAQILV